VNANLDFLILTNIGTNVQGRYSMLMTNIAGGALNVQRTAFLTVLMDSDAIVFRRLGSCLRTERD
jgi:hypothetical protein